MDKKRLRTPNCEGNAGIANLVFASGLVLHLVMRFRIRGSDVHHGLKSGGNGESRDVRAHGSVT